MAQDQRDKLEHLDRLAIKEHQGTLEPQDSLVNKDRLELLDQLVYRELLDNQEPQEPLVLLVHLDPLVAQDQQGLEETQDQMVQLGI